MSQLMENILSNESEPKYLRAGAAADFLNISRTTLHTWTKTLEGFPPPTKMGRRITLYDMPAIISFLARRAAAANADHLLVPKRA